MKQFLGPSSKSGWPFSEGVLIDGTLYLSGRIGFVPGTLTVPVDPAEEAQLLLEGFRRLLSEGGMQMDDLVCVQVFSPDVTLFDTFNKVYRTFFSGELPARAFLGSGPLLFGARFEMIAIARKSQS